MAVISESEGRLCNLELSAKWIFDNFYRRTSKKFGQNFLFNESVNAKIVNCAGDLNGKVVVEIGPGPGGLTLEILKQKVKKLYVVEYDRHWAETWRNLQSRFEKDKLQIIECDALTFDMKKIAPQVIISNLPYNISTQLLFKWLPEFNEFEKLILMFQKEVAERIYAKEKTKAYGKLSVLSQWKSRVAKKFDLEPGSFSPPPKVKSTVLEFTPFSLQELSYSELNFDFFSIFLGDVFMHRRKTVTKALSKYFSDPESVLKNLGYTLQTRPEEISTADFLKIGSMLNSHSFKSLF